MDSESKIETWAIMVPFEGEFMYVLDKVESMDFNTMAVKTFSSLEEAEDFAKVWGESAKVVRYDESSS